MNRQQHDYLKFMIIPAVAFLLLAGCAQLSAPEGSATVRDKLTRLQANQELASRAPVAIKDAEVAVRAAEAPEKDKALARHRVHVADRKVDIAAARAQSRLYEDQRTVLSKASEKARLDSRTREADRANQDAAVAREDADIARTNADIARENANAALLEAEELKRQLDELNARETERGTVITLGDVLFATGRSELSGMAASHLGKLATFLVQHPERNVVIEGHTDSVGNESANFSLSQRRADSVRSYLVHQGVATNRLHTAGLGEGSPVAGNDSVTGRQQNRRVEIIIEK